MSIKNSISAITIKRMSLSPYWSEAFITNEKKNFESLGFKYISSPKNPTHIECNETPDIIITNTHTKFNLFENDFKKNLKLIIHPNSGYDNFNLDFVNSIDCPIILGNPLRANAVSEVILAELFSHFSLAPNQNSWNPQRKWPRKLLSEQNILIIGMGMIGNTVYQALNPLVDNLFLYDPFKGYGELAIKNNLFDVIIMAASLNPSSLHMINADFLKKLSPSGLFINCARGELVNTLDLLAFLDGNPEAFAYLDVFENEPYQFESILRRNLKTTSHIAGVYYNLENNTQNYIMEILKNFKQMPLNEFLETYEKINLKNRIADHYLI